MRWSQGTSDDGVGSRDSELEQITTFPIVLILYTNFGKFF